MGSYSSRRRLIPIDSFRALKAPTAPRTHCESGLILRPLAHVFPSSRLPCHTIHEPQPCCPTATRPLQEKTNLKRRHGGEVPSTCLMLRLLPTGSTSHFHRVALGSGSLPIRPRIDARRSPSVFFRGTRKPSICEQLLTHSTNSSTAPKPHPTDHAIAACGTYARVLLRLVRWRVWRALRMTRYCVGELFFDCAASHLWRRSIACLDRIT